MSGELESGDLPPNGARFKKVSPLSISLYVNAASFRIVEP
jgi:hypothetical protein